MWKSLTIFFWNIEVWAVRKHVNLVDLVKSFPHVPFLNLLFEQIANSNAYLLAQFGFDTAENKPCKVCPLSAYRFPRSTAWRRTSSSCLPSAVCVGSRSGTTATSNSTECPSLLLTSSCSRTVCKSSFASTSSTTTWLHGWRGSGCNCLPCTISERYLESYIFAYFSGGQRQSKVCNYASHL